MKNTLETYKGVVRRAVNYQLGFLLPDGGYIWEGYVNDAYHKQAYSWQLAGHFAEAQRLLNWVKKNTLLPNGQLKDYNGDVYKHSFMFQGAHRLGRFDVSYPVMSFLLSCQTRCGGFPHFAADELVRSLATAWMGVSAIYFGRLDVAEKIARCCISMLEQQPRDDRFYFQMTRDGRLVTEKEYPQAQFIDTSKLKQCYWEVGFPLIFMCRMYQATGERSYLDYAKQLLEFKLRCFTDAFEYWGSGKSALGAMIYYALTGDERAKDAAFKFCDFLVETQLPEGGFRYEDEPDELLIRVDHAACFTIWVQEMLGIAESLKVVDRG